MTTRISPRELKKLVRDRRNEELHLIMRKVPAKELVDSSGKTILHLAAKYGNIELLESLLPYRRAVNAVCSSGMTPLMTALSYNQFTAVKLLLAAKSDISIRNSSGVTALQMAVKQKVPADVIRKFIETMRKLNVSTDRIIVMLERAGCSLKYALTFNDTWVLRTLLERRDTVSKSESSMLVRQAMNYPTKESIANLVTLMNYGRERDMRRSIFLEEISYEVECYLPSRKVGYLKNLMNQLIKADLIDVECASYFAKIFSRGKKSAVKLLLECDVRIYIKERFRMDLLPQLFENSNVNAIKLTNKWQLDVNAKGITGYSALHFAAMSDSIENVKYLLDIGADPNFRDNFGMTPMFVSFDRKCVQLLLENGADVQIRDTDGMTVLDLGRSPMIYCVLAHLALLEAKGITVERYMYEKIVSNKKLKDFYVECRKQLIWMVRRKIFQHTNLFRVLVDEPEDIVQYVPNLGKKSELMNWRYQYPLEKYYVTILKRNLKKAVKMYKLKCKAAWCISKIMRLNNPDHLVVKTIMDYLTYNDLFVFA